MQVYSSYTTRGARAGLPDGGGVGRHIEKKERKKKKKSYGQMIFLLSAHKQGNQPKLIFSISYSLFFMP